MVILQINGHVYRTGEKHVVNVLEAAGYALKGRFAIYALVKGDIVECKKDIYPSKKAMQSAVKCYKAKGFRVFHT